MVAAAIQTSLFADGREFRCSPTTTSGVPRTLQSISSTVSSMAAFKTQFHDAGQLVMSNDHGELLAARTAEPKRGSFREPSWSAVHDITQPRRLRCAHLVSLAIHHPKPLRPKGQRTREQAAARARDASEKLQQWLED